MEKKIGKVTLDFSAYTGKDRYSDGDIELEILAALKEGRAEKMLAGLEECVTDIDGLIAFADSPKGVEVLGGEAAAANTLAAAKDAKAKGTKYCICPACTNGAILLEHRHDLGC